MNTWVETDKQMLKEYTRSIIHMRRQFEVGRFRLVFGTGLTQPVGIPGWNKLNEMVALDSKVDGEKLLGRPTEEKVDEFLKNVSRETIVKLLTGAGPEETITTQKLYEHFKRKRYKQEDPSMYNTPKLDTNIYREWKNIIRDKLYEKAIVPEEILGGHEYLKHFLPIIKNTPLTITYNFDDILEMALYNDPKREEGDRGYEIITDICVLPRRRSAVIYHPNGYIPRNPIEEKTEEIVLSESEFASRMVELTSGEYNSLLHIFSRNTCLFVGLSLKDGILKNLLKQSANIAPGNYHYYVHYCKDNEKLSDEEIRAVRTANFETYNLITLFLNYKGLASTARLIYSGYDEASRRLEDKDVCTLADEVGVDLAFCFYIIGAVGAGKSTCVSQFRNLVTYDEWVEDRLPELAIDWQALEKYEKKAKQKIKKRIDEWISGQFYEKNRDLVYNKVGISVCDRCPLDPIVFTPEPERHGKATLLLKKICPGKTPHEVKSGHVIMLLDDPEHLEIRAQRSHRDYNKDGLKRMQEEILKIYGMDGFTAIDCRFLSFYDVIKSISRIIHMQEYKPAEIHKRLVEIKNGESKCSMKVEKN